MATRPALAVCVTVANCNAKYEHEVRIITDGTRAYAYGAETDSATGHRPDGTVITLTCGQPLHDDVPCAGEVTIDLAEDTWTADPTDRRYLNDYGTAVDR